MRDLLELHFTGSEINPESVRIGEIAVILDAIESVLLAVVTEEHKGLTKEILTIGLHNVTRCS
jgi:hypothetical protein